MRDYIHVSDIAAIHVAPMRDLGNGGDSRVVGCGNGRGFSVRNMPEPVRSEPGARFDIVDGPHRSGDPPVMIADSTPLRAAFASGPRRDDLGFIVRTALAWDNGRAGPPDPGS